MLQRSRFSINRNISPLTTHLRRHQISVSSSFFQRAQYFSALRRLSASHYRTYESNHLYVNSIILVSAGFYSHYYTNCEDLKNGDSSELKNGNNQDDEDEDECPLCRFMKSGPCRDAFLQWQSCVDKHRESGKFAEMCSDQTISLGKCSDEHDLGLFDLVSEDIDENSVNDSLES